MLEGSVLAFLGCWLTVICSNPTFGAKNDEMDRIRQSQGQERDKLSQIPIVTLATRVQTLLS